MCWRLHHCSVRIQHCVYRSQKVLVAQHMPPATRLGSRQPLRQMLVFADVVKGARGKFRAAAQVMPEQTLWF